MALPSTGAWGVFALFLIPVGTGIPGGVLLAKKSGIPWPGMMVLYFMSDVVLACVFEPVMLWLIKAGRKNAPLSKVLDAMRHSTKKTIALYGHATGPMALILIAFGVDPMTGRAAAKAAGHGFVTGWAIAIAGDMMYFTVLMASTLWLNNILGDGTKTMGIILVLMFVVPMLIQKWRERRAGLKA